MFVRRAMGNLEKDAFFVKLSMKEEKKNLTRWMLEWNLVLSIRNREKLLFDIYVIRYR